MERAHVDADYGPMAVLTGLTELEIWFSPPPPSDEAYLLPALPPMPALRSLKLYDNFNGSGAALHDLPNLPVLENFQTNADVAPALFVSAPALHYLGIGGADDFTPFRTLDGLESLYIWRYLPEDLSPLYDLPSLRDLGISGSDAYVTDYVDQLEALHEAVPGLSIVVHYCC